MPPTDRQVSVHYTNTRNLHIQQTHTHARSVPRHRRISQTPDIFHRIREHLALLCTLRLRTGKIHTHTLTHTYTHLRWIIHQHRAYTHTHTHAQRIGCVAFGLVGGGGALTIYRTCRRMHTHVPHGKLSIVSCSVLLSSELLELKDAMLHLADK